MAVTANGVCLLYGAVTVGRFEPAVGGWPEEYGAFCMVLAFAALMVSRSRAMAAENLRLTEHLQEEVDEKTRHLTKLLKERGQLMAELGHDMKSPLTALSNMAQIIRLNDIMLDGDTREKMQGIEDKCSVLADRLESIQELAGEAGALPQMEPLSLNRFLADFYRSNQPVVELTGPDFLCELTPLPCTVRADSRKLTRALENLIYNAGEFTPPDGKIVLSLKREQNFALICVADTGCGIPETEIPKVFDRLYTTREDEGGQGLGPLHHPRHRAGAWGRNQCGICGWGRQYLCDSAAAHTVKTKGALYKHYKNKRDIFDSILERVCQLDLERSQKAGVAENDFDKMPQPFHNTTVESGR